jgi:DNA-binding HxlR family transcriptional regulator
MRGKRTDLSGADCAIARAMHVVGDWWSLLIVRDAFVGLQRFGEFQRSLGLAKNVLSTRLKKLVGEGILKMETDEGASRARYVLTPRGERLYLIMIALWQWGEDFCFKPGELRLAMVDDQNKVPLPKLQALAVDGRPVGPHDFTVAKKSEAKRTKAKTAGKDAASHRA